MDRLTERDARYRDPDEWANPSKIKKETIELERFKKRLQRYENVFEDVEEIPLDRLREICAAEKDGRCVVLPCKVGDTAYVISYCENVMMNCDDDYETGTGAVECPFESDCPFEDCDDGNKRIFETTCSGFFFGDDRSDIFFDHINAEFYITDFGKTVFTVREAAEKALEEKK